MEANGKTYIFLVAGRKAWHHDVPDSWTCEAHERFDYTESAVYSKATADLTDEDKRDWVEYYGDPKGEWQAPDGWNWPQLPRTAIIY